MSPTHLLSNTRVQSPNRRFVIKASAVLTAAMLFLGTAAHAQDAKDYPIIAQSYSKNMQTVQFKNGDINMAGNVYYPDNFDSSKKYAAIVVVHPGGVKEQTVGVYAKKMAEQGFIALAFDASHQGASGGMPRFLDDPMKRVADIYSAVDYLVALPFIDNTRIGALGICAGSGHTIKATTTDRRIKAVATVSAVDVGEVFRKGWDGKGSIKEQLATLDVVAQQRNNEVKGAAPAHTFYVPNVGDTSAPRDLQEAADYYLTPRGQHPNAPNKMLLTSASLMMAYTGFDQVQTLLTQPLLVIAGTNAGSLWHSQALYEKAKGTKELYLVQGSTHMDLYDKDVDKAMVKLAPFFSKNL